MNDFKESIRLATAETKNLSGNFAKLAEMSVVLTSAVSIINSMNQAVGSVADSFDRFDTSMRAVNTMAGKDQAGFKALTNQVEELSKHIPLAKDALANGLYQVISNGVPENNWIEFLEQSARASVGGIADLGETVTVTSTIIKNYGLEWSAAGDIQDKIQMTAKNGVTSFEQLAQALPRVTGSAATLGVTIDELFASFATLTGVTGNTAEVSTQLAAIFTALVKPSSEATTMAQQMGIQFDAAAIKAAGGMRNFLQQLDKDIKSYASAHGQLDQEIYGKLFGSAESLRALTSLTGELSDKFGENVEAMSGSAGTISAAYDSMAGSASAYTQILNNQITTATKEVGAIASKARPYLQYVAILGQATIGMVAMYTSVQKGIAYVKGLSSAEVVLANRINATTLYGRMQAVAMRILTVTTGATTVSVTALTVATTALCAVTGGLLVAGIGALIGALSSYSSSSDAAVEDIDQMASATDAYKEAASQAKSEIELERAKLQDLIKSKKDATDAIARLNQQYGEEFGFHNTASEWYDTLTAKSEDYCRQLAYEAKAKELANKIGNTEVELDKVRNRKKELEDTGQTGPSKLQKKVNEDGIITLERVGSDEYAELIQKEGELTQQAADWNTELQNCVESARQAREALSYVGDGSTPKADWKSMSYTDLSTAVENQRVKVKGLAGTSDTANAKKENEELKRMEARKKALEKQYNLSTSSGSEFDGKSLIANATSYQALGNNVKYYQSQIEKADPSEKQHIANLIKQRDEAQKSQDAVKRLYEELGRPTSFDSLDDFDKELTYLQNQRSTASQEELGQLDAQIKRVTDLKTAFEQDSHIGLDMDAVDSIQQAETELSYWEQRIKQVGGTEREEAVKTRDAWKEKVRVLNEGTSIPVPVADLGNLQQASDAISYYEQRLQHATQTESIEIQKRINEYKRWKKEREAVLKDASKPSDISQLNTVGDLEEAMSWYADSMKTQSDVEIEATQRTITALEKKRDALQRLAAIPKMQSELDDLSGLSGRKLTIELEMIGLDSIRDKIHSLKKLLEDTKNPLGDDQKEEVQDQISAWKKYEKQLKRSTVKITDVWGATKGVGNGIESMTDAIKGSGNAWQKTTGIIDGAIGIYESISQICQIVDTVTKAMSLTKGEEAAATTTAAAATAAGAVTETTAATEEVAASSEVTSAKIGEASSKVFAAHSSIPWVGIAVAGGMVAAMLGIMLGLPKFADGGIAYGPTLGIFGEYANASNNPEVVAPLNKLRNLIEPDAGYGGKVTFKIEGRTLVGVLQKEERVRARTR
jgi:TP901 family phage tail tape measure protein